MKVNHLGSEVMKGLAGSEIPVWKHNFKIELLSADRSNVVWRGKDTIIDCVEYDSIPPIPGFSNFMFQPGQKATKTYLKGFWVTISLKGKYHFNSLERKPWFVLFFSEKSTKRYPFY